MQLGGVHPAHLLAGQGLGLPAAPLAEMDDEAQFFVAVGVLQADQFVAHHHFDRQFFPQFPGHGGLDRLAWLLFAAGKFPQSPQ